MDAAAEAVFRDGLAAEEIERTGRLIELYRVAVERERDAGNLARATRFERTAAALERRLDRLVTESEAKAMRAADNDA